MSGLSAAEQRDLLRDQQDDELRPFLAQTYIDREWRKAEAVSAFLAHKGFMWGGAWGTSVVREVRQSVERVSREEDADGFPRYWFTGRGTYVTLAGLSDEDLESLSGRYGNMASAFARLKARHDRARKARGVDVSTEDLDAMIAELVAIKGNL